ncbi:hypothetical protein EYF80_010297 [Liparis tanakae]|uniref:Uncharacterized protein n=1 Tax=Liparis tanakae TaxID=230148 RepID=A0A4Z2IQP2_9TELE|nr:hypothetical protein EYF80_010297 [Liparis tanakae]
MDPLPSAGLRVTIGPFSGGGEGVGEELCRASLLKKKKKEKRSICVSSSVALAGLSDTITEEPVSRDSAAAEPSPREDSPPETQRTPRRGRPPLAASHRCSLSLPPSTSAETSASESAKPRDGPRQASVFSPEPLAVEAFSLAVSPEQ